MNHSCEVKGEDFGMIDSLQPEADDYLQSIYGILKVPPTKDALIKPYASFNRKGAEDDIDEREFPPIDGDYLDSYLVSTADISQSPPPKHPPNVTVQEIPTLQATMPPTKCLRNSSVTDLLTTQKTSSLGDENSAPSEECALTFNNVIRSSFQFNSRSATNERKRYYNVKKTLVKGHMKEGRTHKKIPKEFSAKKRAKVKILRRQHSGPTEIRNHLFNATSIREYLGTPGVARSFRRYILILFIDKDYKELSSKLKIFPLKDNEEYIKASWESLKKVLMSKSPFE